MAYAISTTTEFEETAAKLKKRDTQLYLRLHKKVDELCIEPHFRKPLGNVLKGSYRVHIGSFVLRYRIDDRSKVIGNSPITLLSETDSSVYYTL